MICNLVIHFILCDLHPSVSCFFVFCFFPRWLNIDSIIQASHPLVSRARWLERMVSPSLTPTSAVILTVATSSTDTVPAEKSSMHGSSPHESRNPMPTLLQHPTPPQTGPLTLPLTQQIFPPLNPLHLDSVSLPSVSYSGLD